MKIFTELDKRYALQDMWGNAAGELVFDRLYLEDDLDTANQEIEQLLSCEQPDPFSRVHLSVVHSVLVIDGDCEYRTKLRFSKYTWIDCAVSGRYGEELCVPEIDQLLSDLQKQCAIRPRDGWLSEVY